MNHYKKVIQNFGKYLMIFVLYSLVSCSSKFPIIKNTDNYHQSPYGAYIELRIQGIQEKLQFKGELIAADNKKVVIRTIGKTETVRPFAIKDILSYNVYYAKNDKEDYTAGNILLAISTISHGFLLLFTLPINGIVFASVHSNRKNEFGYSQKQLPIEELSKFARYPQGLPPHINLNNLIDILPK